MTLSNTHDKIKSTWMYISKVTRTDTWEKLCRTHLLNKNKNVPHYKHPKSGFKTKQTKTSNLSSSHMDRVLTKNR